MKDFSISNVPQNQIQAPVEKTNLHSGGKKEKSAEAAKPQKTAAEKLEEWDLTDLFIAQIY